MKKSNFKKTFDLLNEVNNRLLYLTKIIRENEELIFTVVSRHNGDWGEVLYLDKDEYKKEDIKYLKSEAKRLWNGNIEKDWNRSLTFYIQNNKLFWEALKELSALASNDDNFISGCFNKGIGAKLYEYIERIRKLKEFTDTSELQYLVDKYDELFDM